MLKKCWILKFQELLPWITMLWPEVISNKFSMKHREHGLK
uniref:Uncharacterized protein n=1 Tax=Arundo donax TaxID=35708 RepID=A0A0A9CEI3_ARUDO